MASLGPSRFLFFRDDDGRLQMSSEEEHAQYLKAVRCCGSCAAHRAHPSWANNAPYLLEARKIYGIRCLRKPPRVLDKILAFLCRMVSR